MPDDGDNPLALREGLERRIANETDPKTQLELIKNQDEMLIRRRDRWLKPLIAFGLIVAGIVLLILKITTVGWVLFSAGFVGIFVGRPGAIEKLLDFIAKHMKELK